MTAPPSSPSARDESIGDMTKEDDSTANDEDNDKDKDQDGTANDKHKDKDKDKDEDKDKDKDQDSTANDNDMTKEEKEYIKRAEDILLEIEGTEKKLEGMRTKAVEATKKV